MEIDLKRIAAIASEGAGASISTIAVTLGIGAVITVAVIIALGKLGVFRRPGHSAWHVLAKLWIPFLVIVGLAFSFKIGVVRATRAALVRLGPATVDAIYDRTIGPSLATEADKRAFLLSVQQRAQGTQDLGKAFTRMLKERLHAVPDSARSMSGKAAAMLADLAIDHYQDDIAAAVLYGLYAKSNGYLDLHHTGEPVDYATFKEGIDHLLKMDVAQMERGVKGNLGDLTSTLVETQYKHVLNGALLMIVLLTLLPLAEWGIFLLVSRNRMPVAEASVEGPSRT